jgi:WD40 repeat protein
MTRYSMLVVASALAFTSFARTQDVDFSPDGKRIATGGLDGLVRIYDWATRKELLILDSAKLTVSNLAWSRDSRRLFVRSHDWARPTLLHVWDARPVRRSGR